MNLGHIKNPKSQPVEVESDIFLQICYVMQYWANPYNICHST